MVGPDTDSAFEPAVGGEETGPIRPIALCVLACVSIEAFPTSAASAGSRRAPTLPRKVTVPTAPTPAASVPTSLARARGSYSSAERFRPWEMEVADDGTVALLNADGSQLTLELRAPKSA
jgi:hypothetical protein